MNRLTKGIVMNFCTLATLAFFYFEGTRVLILLVAGGVCLTAINIALACSRSRNG